MLASPVSERPIRSSDQKPVRSKIVEKEARSHYSSLYRRLLFDASGHFVVVSDADADMKVPRGGRFVPAPMRYFMRFHAATGMHAGYLPGYPASHGCVRMPEQNAIQFFAAIEVGTPVHVFGSTPRTRDYFEYGPQPSRRSPNNRRYDPRYDPRFDPRLRDPYYDPRYAPPPGWRY